MGSLSVGQRGCPSSCCMGEGGGGGGRGGRICPRCGLFHTWSMCWCVVCLFGLVVQGFDSWFLRGDFSGSSHTGDLKIDATVVTLPDVWGRGGGAGGWGGGGGGGGCVVGGGGGWQRGFFRAKSYQLLKN